MFKKILHINFIIFFLCSISLAEKIKDISVTGNKRISKESLIVFGQIKIDKEYNEYDLNLILKNLYETNFFEKVNLSINNSTLNINIVENPIIENLEIKGITSKKLVEALKEKITLKSRKSYIQTIFENDLNLIKNIIKATGYYFAEIKTSTILNKEQNSIELIYDIDLGKRAKISEIKFLGDKKIKDRKLFNIITTEEHKFWKFISQSAYLDAARIDLDKRLLKNYYKDNGYYNVDISNSFVEFKNNGTFKLIFNINSGKKFSFNKLNLNLTDDYDVKYFKKIKKELKKLENKTYSLSRIEKVLREVDKVALSKQFEFINAEFSVTMIGDDKIDITIFLTETQKFYVEKINILGNQYTLEEVIRNTLIVDEGDPYNEILFNKSVNNIKAKNIFGKVETNIRPGSNKNLKIIDLSVEEKATGEISLGAGVGTSGGTVSAGIKENNFMGKGVGLNTNLSISENAVKGQFTYFQPNFNNSDNSLSTSINNTVTDNLTDFGYKTTNFGFSLGTTFQQYENFYFSPTLAADVENMEINSNASSTLKKQKGDYFDTYLNYSLDYDLRNKRYRADDGFRNVFYQELPLVSESSEIVNSFESTKYQKISETVIQLSFLGKAVNSLKNDDVRISKRLFMPAKKLRGFESGKVGPQQNNAYVGGNYISAVNLTATLPELLPNFQNTDIAFFVDAANVWGVDYDSSVDKNSKIRSAVGIGINVLTPIGPLSFSLAQPITKASSDKTETFRFNLGTTF